MAWLGRFEWDGRRSIIACSSKRVHLCCLAFALTWHAQQRIKLAQQAVNVERTRTALHGVQANSLEHKRGSSNSHLKRPPWSWAQKPLRLRALRQKCWRT